MYCVNCGSQVKDMAVVCSGCGHSVGDAPSRSSSEPKRWSWFTMFVTIGVFVVLLLIAIIAGL